MMSEGAWWAQRWLDPIVEPREFRQQVRKGKIAANRGWVSNIVIRPGLVTAVVAEDTGASSNVRLRQPRIEEETWVRVITRLGGEVAHAAALLSGRINKEMEGFFEESGAELFPFDHHDLTYFCTCTDNATVCKHGVAVHFALAKAMTADPFVFIGFRGKDRDAFMEELHAARAAGEGREEAGGGGAAASNGGVQEDPDFEPAEALREGYWRAGVIPHLAFRIDAKDVALEEAFPVIRALGPGPSETRADDIARVLAPIARMARRRIEEIVGQVVEDESLQARAAPRATDAESLEEILVAAAHQHGSLTSRFVADALDIHQLKARRYLKWLVAEGRLEQIGRARGTRYVPPGQGGAAAEADDEEGSHDKEALASPAPAPEPAAAESAPAVA